MVYVVNRDYTPDADRRFDELDGLGVYSPSEIVPKLGGVTVLGVMKTPSPEQVSESSEDKNISQN